MEPLKRYDLPDLFPELGSPPPNSVANKALNQWIDRNLTNYVKKQMATPDDPVRKLAEEGVVHIPSEQVGINRYLAPEVRRHYGTEQLGKSEAARAWEDSADVAVSGDRIKDFFNNSREPWMANADPNTMIYSPIRVSQVDFGQGLGFDHIVDVLKQDLASGRIRPEQLSKVSMEQAVRRTAEFDQEMAKRMREAQIKATEGMPVYREYPEGYRWVELTQPKELPAGMKETVDKRYLRNEAGELVEDPRYKALEDALKYEGDTMGHCVGGYCPDVAQGRSRIYSLRDAKGEPHVTVEVRPGVYTPFDMPEDIYPIYRQHMAEGVAAHGGRPGAMEWMQHFYPERYVAKPEEIVQIKGKQNKAPNEQYLPFVQDFVRSGHWSDVGDLANTGLYRANPEELGMFIPSDPALRNLPGRRTDDFIKAKEAGLFGDRQYLTRDEFEDILRRQIESESGPLPPAEGMKAGGEVNLSGGGLSKIATEAMSKLKGVRKEFVDKVAEQARYQKETAHIPTKDLPSFEEWKAKQINVTPENIEQLRKETGNRAGGEVKMAAGGLRTLKNLLGGGSKTEDAATAAQRAAAGRMAADVAKATQPMKMSEALGKLNVEGKGKVKVTQSDRTRVGGGNIGGAMFPGLSQVDPFYQDLVWGVGKKSTGSGLINQSDDLTYWSTLLGSEDQLKSNPIVFNKLRAGFVDAMKQGKLSKELEDKINKNLSVTFGEGADIRDPKIWQKADTFERRTALADVMLGQGLPPSKGGVPLGGEKSGKGVIFKPTDVLKRETEPMLLHPEHGGDVPTFAVGPRLFQFSGGMQVRPDLHPGFPVLLEGQDMGMVFRPAPGEIAMRDFTERMVNERGRKPGYYEWTMGERGKGLPSQLITDEYLTYLQKRGYADGGSVSGLSVLEKV